MTLERQSIIEFVRFALSGGFVSVAHLLFVYVLTDFLGVWYLVSTTVSFITAVILNFLLQKFFVRRNYDRESTRRQFFWYSVSSGIYLSANTLGMYLLVEKGNIGYLLAQVIIICILSTITFFVNRNLIFK